MSGYAVKSIHIHGDPTATFRHIQDVRTWPRWARHRIQSLEGQEGGAWHVIAPNGKAQIHLKADPERGLLDHRYVDAHGAWSIPARLVPVPGGAVLTVVLTQPPGVSDEQFQRTLDTWGEELKWLKEDIEAHHGKGR